MIGEFKRLGKHSAIYGLSNILNRAIALVLLPLYTRSLTPADYGVLEILTVTTVFISIALELGLGTAVFRAALYDKDRSEKVLISTAFYFLITSSGVFSMMLFFLAPSVARLVLDMPKHANLVRVVFFTALLDAIGVIPLARLRMHEESIKYSAISMGRFAVGLLLNIYFIVGLGRGVEGLVIAGAIQSAIFALILVATLARTLQLSFSSTALRAMLSFGLPLVPMSIAANILGLADRYFLRYYSTLEETGIYAAAYRLGAVINLLVGSFQVAWPAVLFSVARRDEAKGFYSRLLTYSMLVLAFIGLGVSALSREALKVLTTEQFLPAHQVVPFVVLSYIFLGGYYVTAVGTNLAKKTQYLALATIVAAVLHLFLNSVLIPRHGMMGAAISTVTSYGVMLTIACSASLRFYPIDYEWGRLARIALVGVVLYGASRLIRTDILVVDVLLKTMVVVSFPLFLGLLGFYTGEERSTVHRWAAGSKGQALSWLKGALREIKRQLFRILAKMLLPPNRVSVAPQQVERILIYGAMGIGNMIMFTPTLRAIRRHFADAHIALLVADSGCDQVLRGSALVDEIIRPKPGRFRMLRLARRMRERRFDLLFSEFHGSIFNVITLCSSIPCRVGHCTSPGWENRYDFLYNVPVRMREDEHEIDRGLRLARVLGIHVADDRPTFHVSDEDRVSADDFMRLSGVQEGDLVVGVQVGTWRVQSWKQWDLTRLGQVCDRLIDERRAKVIALGDPRHQQELDTFLESMECQPIVALGQTTLKQAAAIVEQCDFAICNDSGLMHIAAAMGTPVIAVFGPTDYRRTSPRRYGEQHIVLRTELDCSPCFRMAGEAQVASCPHRECLESIAVQDLIQAAEMLIGEKPLLARSRA